jgi:hypothetical protein
MDVRAGLRSSLSRFVMLAGLLGASCAPAGGSGELHGADGGALGG